MPKKKRFAPGKVEAILEKGIIQIFKHNHSKPLNYKQIAAQLQISDKETRQMVLDILEMLKTKEVIVEKARGKYQYNPQLNKIVGTIEITRKGTGFILLENAKDLFIAARNTGTAMNGDLVKVAVTNKRGRNEYRVAEVIERNKKIFTGILERVDGYGFVHPDDDKVPADFYIREENIPEKAIDGQKVVVELLVWDDPTKNPNGKIIQVLGFPGENEAEINAVMVAYNLPPQFPEAVSKAADALYKDPKLKEISNRKDFREVTTFTIDPHDAKDFDDALSYQRISEDEIEVGVHIADVTHYLQEDSILDKEAYKRATSVYLVDRVIPMLPEVLSNDLCSLRPNEDRFAFSAVFVLNNQGKVKKQWFGKTIIHSNRRFAYEEAQEIIEGKKDPLSEEITHLNAIAKALRKQRLSQGAIEFGSQEVKFVLDEHAKPKEVVVKTSKEAHKLIEEFMLLANRKVAEFVGKQSGQQKTFVYRIHDLPDPEKLRTLKDFLRNFGLKLEHVKGKAAAFALNQLLKSVEGKSIEGIVKNLAVRAMAKAEYSPDNIGHYGLAFEHYTHFTSPIRRYPDVMVHRLLQFYLEGGKQVDGDYGLACRHCSLQEKNATEAERTSVKYMQVLFMEAHVGEEFDGIVTGITPWGFFVEVEATRCEGLVSLDSLDDDFYEFDDRKHKLVGQRHGKEIHFGDRVLVKVLKADIIEKKLDFALIDTYETF